MTENTKGKIESPPIVPAVSPMETIFPKSKLKESDVRLLSRESGDVTHVECQVTGLTNSISSITTEVAEFLKNQNESTLEWLKTRKQEKCLPKDQDEKKHEKA